MLHSLSILPGDVHWHSKNSRNKRRILHITKSSSMQIFRENAVENINELAMIIMKFQLIGRCNPSLHRIVCSSLNLCTELPTKLARNWKTRRFQPQKKQPTDCSCHFRGQKTWVFFSQNSKRNVFAREYMQTIELIGKKAKGKVTYLGIVENHNSQACSHSIPDRRISQHIHTLP